MPDRPYSTTGDVSSPPSSVSSASEASRLLTERDAELAEARREVAEWKQEAHLSKWPKDAAQEFHRLKAAEPALQAKVTQLRAERGKLQGRVYALETSLPENFLEALDAAERLAHDRGEAAKDAIRIVEECPTDAGEGFYIEALLAVRDRLAGVVPPE